MEKDRTSWIIAFFVTMAAIIVFGIIAIRCFLWWDGTFVILGIMLGIGLCISVNIPPKKKAEK